MAETEELEAAPEDEVVIARGETLAFSEPLQMALLGHLVQDHNFFLLARPRLKAEWFNDPWVARVWGGMCDFFAEHKRTHVSVDEFLSHTMWARLDQGERLRIKKTIDLAISGSKNFGLDFLRKQLTTWLRSRIFKAYMEKAASVYNSAEGCRDMAMAQERFEEAFRFYKRGGLEVEQATFEMQQAVDWSDVATGEFLKSQEDDLKNALTFGLDVVDKCLNPSSICGALLRGDHTTILAPINIGKTRCMVTIAVANALRKHDVLFVTHEGRWKDLKRQFLQALLKKDWQGLMDFYDTPEGKKAFAWAAKWLKQHLTYIPVNKPGMTVEDVETVIRQAQERHIAEYGKGYDMLVDDYPAKLTTALASKGHWPRRASDAYVYNFFTQIGLELDVHVVDAIQVNREGSRVNRDGEERLLTMEDVSECWDAMATASSVLTMNRSTKAQQQRRLTFHIVKSRGGEVGWSIVTRTAYDKSITHGSGLKATYYRGEETLGEAVDSMVEQYAGQMLPDDIYYNAALDAKEQK